MRLHSWAGYTLLGLILVRLVWGFIGPGATPRFSDFVHRPEIVIRYLKDELGTACQALSGTQSGWWCDGGGAAALPHRDRVQRPAAVWSSGVFRTARQPDGGHPRASWPRALEELHELLAHLSLLLVGLHLAGVLFASRLHNENLVRAMITGYKRRAS